MESLKELLNSPEKIYEFGSELTLECPEVLNRKKERNMIEKDIQIVTGMGHEIGFFIPHHYIPLIVTLNVIYVLLTITHLQRE